MSDFELKTNEVGGEEDAAHAAYIAVRDQIGEGAIRSWEEIAELFGLEVPDPDDPAWTQYVQRRCNLKIAVNRKAAANGQPWRLYIHTYGESVIKKYKTFMVKTEIVERMGKIERGLSLASKSARAMRIAEGLNKRDKLRLEQIMNVTAGARMAVAGAISQMDALDKETKQVLLTMYDAGDETDDA